MQSSSLTVDRSRARWALGLWLALAFVVFNVRFDWQTRAIARAFADEQFARYQHGLPTTTINDGFRPLVRAAAGRAALWSGLIAGGGAAATAWASRNNRSRAPL